MVCILKIVLIFPIFKPKNAKKTGGRENQPKIDLYCERLAWQKGTIIKIILALLDFKTKLINIYIVLREKGPLLFIRN